AGRRVFSFLFDQLRRAKTIVSLTGLDKPCRRRFMLSDATRLKEGPFVPVQAEPGQRFQDALCHLFAGTFQVGIFDPKNKTAVMFAGKQPDKESRPRRSNMKKTSRRGRDPDAYRVAHLVEPGLARQFS